MKSGWIDSLGEDRQGRGSLFRRRWFICWTEDRRCETPSTLEGVGVGGDGRARGQTIVVPKAVGARLRRTMRSIPL